MKILFIFLFSFILAHSTIIFPEDEYRFILDDKMIHNINSANLPWKAHRNKRFENVTFAQAKRMQGSRRDPSLRKTVVSLKQNIQLPTFFDARKQWPGCVGAILDQGQCGSCWAFGATESLSDRFCIQSKNKTRVTLSPQSLVSCDWEGNFGCDGGIPQLAWEYMEWAGVLTLECLPYTAGNGNVVSCPSSCPGTPPYKKYYAQKFSQNTYLTVNEIQQAIMTDGPVEGTMDVYDDFMTYKSGVYVTSPNATYLGGHAIKIIGWGHDQASGLDYWICQNSWGPDWGLNGFFWIERGVDMCGIDHDAVAGVPSL